MMMKAFILFKLQQPDFYYENRNWTEKLLGLLSEGSEQGLGDRCFKDGRMIAIIRAESRSTFTELQTFLRNPYSTKS